MAKRKPEYTAEQFKALRSRLVAWSCVLENTVRSLPTNATFDDACRCRDHAQHLVATLNYLSQIDTVIELAQHKGTHPMHLDLEAIGLNAAVVSGEIVKGTPPHAGDV